MWAKNSKNTKNVVSFFLPREKKTEKCASGEVGRRSYVPAQKKKLYPFGQSAKILVMWKRNSRYEYQKTFANRIPLH